MTGYFFTSEIKAIEEIRKKVTSMKVFTPDGRELGKVSKVYVDNLELSGIRVGRRYYNKEDIDSIEEVVVINQELSR